jgi:hypothetical protein
MLMRVGIKRVLEAPDGAEALGVLAESKPDLVALVDDERREVREGRGRDHGGRIRGYPTLRRPPLRPRRRRRRRRPWNPDPIRRLRAIRLAEP